MRSLSKSGKKKISLDEIRDYQGFGEYSELAEYIGSQIEKGRLAPIKSGGTNGKKPPLFLSYRILSEKKDYGRFYEELQYDMVPELSIDYYMAHPEVYETDRPYVLALNRYLKERRERSELPVSVNERSFAVWGREKFLVKEGGMRILKNVGLELSSLAVYATAEPLAYYSRRKEAPQSVIILENKDTFYSMRRFLLGEGEGSGRILGVETGTLIYGAGKGICRSFGDAFGCLEPYLEDPGNEFLYFGDLDYEGIGIYESLKRTVGERIRLRPFRTAYLKMLEKAREMEERRGIVLPAASAGQNRNAGEEFFGAFAQEEREAMAAILSAGQYIPQEILTIEDYRNRMGEPDGL